MDYREQNPHNALYESLVRLPKIELHRHLEGSLRLGTLADIARQYKLKHIPGYRIEDFRQLVQIASDDKPQADVFLSKFAPLRLFYRSPEIIRRVAYEAVEDAARENIVYMELRFTPIALGREMGYPLGEVADWVIDAVEDAMRDYRSIKVRLIVSMNRHESVEIGEQIAGVALSRMNRGVVGLDLAGAENIYPGEPFAPLFRKAREAGLQATIHAGEWAGPESIREAIEVLGARRLGHGVRVLEDADVVRMTRDQGIAFEVCVTSNVQSGVSSRIAQHPLRTMYHLGLKTTINTDDPSISAINLTDEYVAAVRHLEFTMSDLRQHALNAAEHSFLPDDERKRLEDRLRELWTLQDEDITARAKS
ncbi:MAG: adenosine deaminase [Anaerolineae bacterium]|nr:adenosine deaminase [Anaerolineae bacterium]